MKNIELKVKVDMLGTVRKKLELCRWVKICVLHQIDTYFNTKNGRFKLREIH